MWNRLSFRKDPEKALYRSAAIAARLASAAKKRAIKARAN
jgi:hypothetical protein